MASIDLKQCNSLCHECIKEYIKEHRLKKGDLFKVKCAGIPLEYLSDSILSSLGGDPQAALAMVDPVTWAAEFLDWYCLDPDGEIWKRKTEEGTLPPKAASYDPERAAAGKSIFHRPYQNLMLRCSSQRKVFLIGRQAGKCLVSGTLVQLANGQQKPIENIQDGDMVIGLDDNYNLVPAAAYKSFNGIKQVAKLELMDGREIEGSLNHPFLVRKNLGRETTGKRRVILEDQWLELGELREGDCVAVPRNIGELGSEDYEDDYKIDLLGLMLADGNITSKNCRFSNQNHEILQSLRHSCHMLDCSLTQYPSDAEHDYHITGKGAGQKHPIRDWFRELGIWGLDSHNKYIPDFIFTLKNKCIAQLLNRMYGCDGWACVGKSGKPEIGYSTVSEKMANQIISLLARFGIYADMRHKTVTLNGKKFHSRQIVISRRESIVRFAEQIGILGKSQKVEWAKLAALERNPSYKTEVYEENDIVFIPVRSIKLIGEKATWDLSVPDTKNFVANNIISHNTETLCIVMLFNAWVNEKFKIVVVTPYQAQIEMIFGRITDLIDSNSMLRNSTARNVKAPNYQIKFHNGSQLLGFTAGTRSGQEAGAARGQPANMLVFDEADMLSAADLNSTLATIANFPEATVWMSSTPTGKREKFYETCRNKLYRKFYYPSQVNPNWTEDLDEFFRSELTEDGYQHEICFTADTLIKTINGPKKIIDITSNDFIYNHLMEPCRVINSVTHTGTKKVWEFETSAGLFTCTPNHYFPNRQFQKTRIKDLKEIPVYFDPEERYVRNDREEVYARLVSYNLGDGSSCSTRYQSSFYSNTKIDIQHIIDDIKYLYPEYKGSVVYDRVKNVGKSSSLVKVDGDRYAANVGKNITLDLIDRGIIRGKRTYQEFVVPNFVKVGTNNVKRAFLGALFGAEGSNIIDDLSCKGYIPHSISLSMNKQKDINGHNFFQSLVDLLLSLDIMASYTHHINQEGYQTYILYIGSSFENVLKFLDKVGYYYASEKELEAFRWKHYIKHYQNALLLKQQLFDCARKKRKEGFCYKDITDITGLTIKQIYKAVKKNIIPKRLYNKEYPYFNEWVKERKINYNNGLFIDIFGFKKLDQEKVYNFTVNTFDHSYLLNNNIRTFNCALFGQQEEGVYQVKYVEAAQSDFEYGQLKPNFKWTYMMGVDWNDQKVGTTIAVVGHNPNTNYFHLVDKAIVSRGEWTQLSACQKIAELNRFWNPSFIYVDQGYGTTQIELLHDYGLRSLSQFGPNHPDSRLRDIVKGYDFGSSIEIRDPFTKQPTKKPAKPFLVENSVRRFEALRFKYPKSDQSYIDQLLGYIILRTSQTGRPIYEAQNKKAGDHLLDAVNLALVAFTLEKGKFSRPVYDQKIAITGHFGEQDRKDINSTKPEKRQPGTGRSDILHKDSKPLIPQGRELPAANTSVESNIKIWDWPGWGHDAPKPEPRSLREAFRQAEQRIYHPKNRRKRPSRTKI